MKVGKEVMPSGEKTLNLTFLRRPLEPKFEFQL